MREDAFAYPPHGTPTDNSQTEPAASDRLFPDDQPEQLQAERRDGVDGANLDLSITRAPGLTVIRGLNVPHIRLEFIDNGKAYWQQRLVRSGLLGHLTKVERRVLDVLMEAASVRHWMAEGELCAWPSAEEIGRRARVNPNGFYRARTRLVEHLGLLVVREAGGGRRRTKYVLALPPDTDCPEYLGDAEHARRRRAWERRSTRPDLKVKRGTSPPHGGESARAHGGESARAHGGESARAHGGEGSSPRGGESSTPSDSIKTRTRAHAGAGAGVRVNNNNSDDPLNDQHQQARQDRPERAVVVELLRSVKNKRGERYGEAVVAQLAAMPSATEANVRRAVAAAARGDEALGLCRHLIQNPHLLSRDSGPEHEQEERLTQAMRMAEASARARADLDYVRQLAAHEVENWRRIVFQTNEAYARAWADADPRTHALLASEIARRARAARRPPAAGEGTR